MQVRVPETHAPTPATAGFGWQGSLAPTSHGSPVPVPVGGGGGGGGGVPASALAGGGSSGVAPGSSVEPGRGRWPPPVGIVVAAEHAVPSTQTITRKSARV